MIHSLISDLEASVRGPTAVDVGARLDTVIAALVNRDGPDLTDTQREEFRYAVALLHVLNRSDLALKLLHAVVENCDSHGTIAHFFNLAAMIHFDTGQQDLALSRFEDAFLEASRARNAQLSGVTALNLATASLHEGELADAKKWLTRAEGSSRHFLKTHGPAVGVVSYWLAVADDDLTDIKSIASRLADPGVPDQLAADSSRNHVHLATLAVAEFDAALLSGAIPRVHECLDALDVLMRRAAASTGPRSPVALWLRATYAGAAFDLAVLLSQEGTEESGHRLSRAGRRLEQLLEIFTTQFGPTHPWTVLVEGDCATAELETARAEGAPEKLRSSVDRLGRVYEQASMTFSDSDRRTRAIGENYAEGLLDCVLAGDRSRVEDASTVLAHLVKVSDEELGIHHPTSVLLRQQAEALNDLAVSTSTRSRRTLLGVAQDPRLRFVPRQFAMRSVVAAKDRSEAMGPGQPDVREMAVSMLAKYLMSVADGGNLLRSLALSGDLEHLEGILRHVLRLSMEAHGDENSVRDGAWWPMVAVKLSSVFGNAEARALLAAAFSDPNQDAFVAELILVACARAGISDLSFGNTLNVIQWAYELPRYLRQEVETRRRHVSASAIAAILSSSAAQVPNLVADVTGLGTDYAGTRLMEEALQARDGMLGPAHAETMRARNDLAQLYYSVGRYDSSARLLERNLELAEQSLGLGDDDTLTARENLAVVYDALGRRSEVIRLLEENVEYSRRIPPGQSPAAASSRNRLGQLYLFDGQTAKAAAVLKEVVEGVHDLSFESKETLAARNNLGVIFLELGDRNRAEALFRENHRRAAHLLGIDHPDTRQAAQNLEQFMTPDG